MRVDSHDFRGSATGDAVETLAQVLAEREKTKRLLIGAACLLFIIAALVAVFAPSGKEGLSYALSAVLVVIALGAIGAAQFKVRLPGINVEANNGRPIDPSSFEHYPPSAQRSTRDVRR